MLNQIFFSTLDLKIFGFFWLCSIGPPLLSRHILPANLQLLPILSVSKPVLLVSLRFCNGWSILRRFSLNSSRFCPVPSKDFFISSKPSSASSLTIFLLLNWFHQNLWTKKLTVMTTIYIDHLASSFIYGALTHTHVLDQHSACQNMNYWETPS